MAPRHTLHLLHVLLVGGTQAARERAAIDRQNAARAGAVLVLPGDELPFRRHARSNLPVARPLVVRFDRLDRAFPALQSGGMRLVLTQSMYLLQSWLDLLGPTDRIIATADRKQLQRVAPEAFQKRGPWRAFEVVDLGRSPTTDSSTSGHVNPALPLERRLARAFSFVSTDERLQLCRSAAREAPQSAVAWLTLASASREALDSTAAREALDRALQLSADWAAVHFEDGKFWLDCEEMERARDAFQRACSLMPSFAAAHSNLGAVLGELDKPEAAVAAFNQALLWDPEGVTILNNIGVVNRELGRLEASEAALRRLVAIAPEFVFGHYNLGHTLLLGRNYSAAVAAYEEGQRRDPEKNRRQACRLAVARFANGDAAGAERDLWRFVDQAPAPEREDLLLEAYEVAHALTTGRSESGAGRAFLDRIAAELNR